MDQSEQIEFGMDDFQAPFQVSDPVFLLRDAFIRNNVSEHLVGNHDIAFLEIDLGPDLRQQILFRNHDFLGHVVSGRLDAIHTIFQDGIHQFLVIVAKDEQTLAEIEIDFAKILVVELVVLGRIGQMCEHPNNLLTTRRITHLVQLVEIDDRIHAFAVDQDLHNLAPATPFVRIGMSFQETGVARAAQGNQGEFAAQDLADTFLDQTRFPRAGRAFDGNRRAHGRRIRDPLSNHLHDLQFGLVVAIDTIVEDFLGVAHVLITCTRSVSHVRYRYFLVDVNRDPHKCIYPILEFRILAVARFHILQHVEFVHDHRLVFRRDRRLQQGNALGNVAGQMLIDFRDLFD